MEVGVIKHLGDITKINGAEIPPVDCITFGSPCQDVSVAGLRKGMKHEDLGDDETTRSGLFFEAIRIIKEMRENDRKHGRPAQFCRPRFAVLENVPGLLSSNSGRDFQTVLTEIVRIAEPESPHVPLPEKGWAKAGCFWDEMGRWSVAFRIHDAQFWGVPQRRRRIAVLVDFAGLTAPEIMFDPQYRRTSENGEPIETVTDSGDEPGQPIQPVGKGVSRDFEQSGEAREGTAGSAEEGTDRAISFQERAGKPGGGKGILIQDEHVGALSTLNNQSVLPPSGGQP